MGIRRKATDDKDTANMLCAAHGCQMCVVLQARYHGCVLMTLLKTQTATENKTKCYANCGPVKSSADGDQGKKKQQQQINGILISSDLQRLMCQGVGWSL